MANFDSYTALYPVLVNGVWQWQGSPTIKGEKGDAGINSALVVNEPSTSTVNAFSCNQSNETFGLKNETVYDIYDPSIPDYGYPAGFVSSATNFIPINTSLTYDVYCVFSTAHMVLSVAHKPSSASGENTFLLSPDTFNGLKWSGSFSLSTTGKFKFPILGVFDTSNVFTSYIGEPSVLIYKIVRRNNSWNIF